MNNKILSQSDNIEYIECANNITKPSNYYFNKEEKIYKVCYELCATCDYGGDVYENNCTSCQTEYIKSPDYPNSLNCVIQCNYFYYYTKYNLYKCTDSPQCPDDFNLLIKEKGKCIDNCKNDEIFQYQYNGRCYKECPNETKSDNDDYLCKDIDLNKCKLSQDDYIFLSENITEEEIDIISQKYAKDFYYNENHVSIFKNPFYSITLYKNSYCISELKLNLPEINFGECYEKVKTKYQINTNLIIVIIKNIKNSNYIKIFPYYMYNPNNGEKLEYIDICEDDILIIQEDILRKLNNSKTDINSILYLTQQNIDVFNLSSVFYTDICYHFDFPIDKDIALKDRILLYYPNITLCEDGCQTKGVNLTSLKAICNCKLNNIIKKNLFENNAIYQSSFGELEDMVSNTNIEVMKCFNAIFTYNYAISSPGVYLIILILISQIILTIIYFQKYSFLLKKYVFNITDKFLTYLKIKNNDKQNNYNNFLYFSNSNNKEVINEPIKRKKKKKSKKKRRRNNIDNNSTI